MQLTKKQRLSNFELDALYDRVYLQVVKITHLVPKPITKPEVTNNPPILCVENPLKISPTPNSDIPKSVVDLAPSALITLALTSASTEIIAIVKDPTKASVEGEDRCCWTRAAWMMPQLYVVPMIQKAMVLHAKTTTQP